jgi:transposase
MPAAKPAELRRRAVELARSGQLPVARVAKDLGISESCLRRWMAQDDVDSGRREGLTSQERQELVELRRRNRVLEMGVEILKRARPSSGSRSPAAAGRSPAAAERSRLPASCPAAAWRPRPDPVGFSSATSMG